MAEQANSLFTEKIVNENYSNLWLIYLCIMISLKEYLQQDNQTDKYHIAKMIAACDTIENALK